jgi:hypothetical protein
MSDLPGPLHPWINDESAKVVLDRIVVFLRHQILIVVAGVEGVFET